jgi:hypothetical protein
MSTRFRTAVLAFVVGALIGIGHVVYTQSTGDTSATKVQHSAQHLDWAQAAAHSHTSAAVITLTAAPAQFVYVTGLDISNCQGTAIAAAAAPTYVTTAGLTGSPQYQIGSGPVVAGTCSPTSTFAFSVPLKSTTAGTNVTFTLPTFIANQVASVNVYYYIGL